MKIRSDGWRQRIRAAIPLAVILGLVLCAVVPWSKSSPIPGVTITAFSNNTVTITVTNGVTNEFYEIYTRPFLQTNEAYLWSLTVTGSLGVTQFTIFNGARQMRFFKAEAGNDKDGDGILNFQDADPLNSSVSNVLKITIQSPTNGMNIQ
jgi:hypothetical protein